MTEISREAGVTHALISVYFNGKAGILYEILTQQNLEQIARSRAAEAAPGDTLARVMRLLEIWAEHDLRDPRLLSVMLAYSWQWPNATEQNNRAQLDQALAPLRRILAKGIAAGELRRDLDVDALIAVIFAIYTQGLRPAIFDAADAAHCLGQMRTRLELVFTGART